MKSKEQLAAYDSESIGFDDDNDTIIVDIDEAAKATVIESLSRLYEKPIESVVREITSNCFDSHMEAGVSDPVEVGFGYESNKIYIYFKDVGLGMSPEFIRRVYGKVGASTRRDSNLFIGAKGYGSKSPISYTDEFYIDTVVDGVKYEYIYHKGEMRIPKIDLLNKTSTTQRNGTIIKIFLKDSDYSYSWKSEETKWQEALDEQLIYFDNVYFKNTSSENYYKIYEFKTFKYRPSISIKDLHIVYGKVYYPINFKILGIEPIKLPFGIKFEIGELRVTPSREAIEYTKEEILLIKERIKLFQEELETLIKEGTTQYDDFFSYVNYIDSDNINFKSLSLKIPFLKEMKLKLNRFKNYHNLDNEQLFNYVNSVINVKFEISKGRKKDWGYEGEHFDSSLLEKNKDNFYRISIDKINTKVNTFLNKGLVIKTINKTRSYSYLLKLYGRKNIEYTHYTKKRYSDEVDANKKEKKVKLLFNSSDLNLIRQLRREILTSFVKISKKYEDVENSQEFLNHIKQLRSERTSIGNDELIIHSLNGSELRETIKISTLDNVGFLVIGTKEQKDELKKLSSVLSLVYSDNDFVSASRNRFKTNSTIRSNRLKYKVFYTANKNILPLYHYYRGKITTMDDLIYTDNNIIRKIATKVYIYFKILEIFDDSYNLDRFMKNIFYINSDIYCKCKNLKDQVESFNKYSRLDDDVKTLMKEVIFKECNKYVNPTYIQYINEIEEYYNGIEILSEGEFDLDRVLPIMYISNKKMDSELYTFAEDWYETILRENEEKIKYLSSLNKKVEYYIYYSDINSKLTIKSPVYVLNHNKELENLNNQITFDKQTFKNLKSYERAFNKSKKNRQKLQCCNRRTEVHQSC
jgi:hypothetical protein